MTLTADPPADADLDTRDPRDPELRLEKLFDSGSLTPLSERDRSGALTARGTINAAPVVAFCTDATTMGGAMGAQGCRHIVDAIDAAVRERVAVIGVWHSGGARPAEPSTPPALHLSASQIRPIQGAERCKAGG